MLQIKNNNQSRQNMYVDIGVYGVPKAEDYETVNYYKLQKIESKLKYKYCFRLNLHEASRSLF